MAVKTCLLLLIVAVICILQVQAGDPDLLTDFVVPEGVIVNANHFTFRGLNQSLLGEPKNASFKLTKVSQIEFPVLTGQSVSLAILQYAPGGINPLHTHPRSAELLILLQGTLKVGFVDSSNKLFTSALSSGDVFVFPKGLVHYQINTDPKFPAVALSSFGSANAGAVSLPKAIFQSGISAEVLAMSFKVDVNTINELVSANMG